MSKLDLNLLRHRCGSGVRSDDLPAADIANGLEAGTVDLAMGYFPDLKKNNFFQQVLYSDGFVSLLRADHPRPEAVLAP